MGVDWLTAGDNVADIYSVLLALEIFLFCSDQQLDVSKLPISANFTDHILVFVELVQFLRWYANDRIASLAKQIENVRVCEVTYLHREVVSRSCVIKSLITSFTIEFVTFVNHFFLTAWAGHIKQRLSIVFITAEYNSDESLDDEESWFLSFCQHWVLIDRFLHFCKREDLVSFLLIPTFEFRSHG